MPTTEQQQDWAVLPYNSSKISGKYVISNHLGCWDILDPEEFKKFELLDIEKGSDFYNRLYDKGVIVDKENLSKTIVDYHKLNANLFSDASLHIAVLTTRCNIACNYCQTLTDNPTDMDTKTAAQILNTAFSMRNPNLHLEFQGGEALLKWDVITYMVDAVNNFNRLYKKNMAMSIVTNGVLLKDDKMDYLVDNGVSICMSLDGPAHVHNQNRKFSKGQETYEYVTDAIKRLKAAYDKRGLKRPINLLPTINRDNLGNLKEIIDEYVKWGVTSVALRPINKLGGANKGWDDLGITPEEFNPRWAEAMDHILELNKQGIDIRERMAGVMLTKILAKKDAGYVDFMNPCGAGRSVLAYMPNGDIYPTDESRMLESDFFKLGNVYEDTYEEVMKTQKMFAITQSSVMDLYDYNTAFTPWLGTDPVLNYKHQGNLVPKIRQTPKYKIDSFQMEYLFKKIIEDKANLEIFERWVSE